MNDDRAECTNLRSLLVSRKIVNVVLQDTDDHYLYESVVTDFDDEYLYITPPIKGKGEIRLKEGDKLVIFYFEIDARYDFELTIAGSRIPSYGGFEYQCAIPTKGWRLQRRKFFRFPVHMDAQYRIVENQKDEKGSTQLVPQDDFLPCNIVDISGGGGLLMVNTPLAVGNYIELNFELTINMVDQPFREIVEVVRVLDRTTREYAHCYGVQFFLIQEAVRNNIMRFVIQKQREFLST